MTGYRNGGGGSNPSKVLGLTLKGWILVIVSIIISLLLEPVGGDLMYALAQKVRPDNEAFLVFLVAFGFILSAFSVWGILQGLIALILRRRRNH
jgi:hypothetical protein